MSTVVKDLGAVSAYAYAVEKGYTGTEAEFAELMADYAEVGQRAEDAADSALESKTAAQTAATTATNKASEATTAATTATTKAGEASTSASTATSAKDTAVSASQTATTKATEATTAAATATSAKTDAVAANTAAQSAKTAAQTAQTGAETAAASVSASAAQIATNTDDIAQLKSDLSIMGNAFNYDYIENDWDGNYVVNISGAKSQSDSYRTSKPVFLNYGERLRVTSALYSETQCQIMEVTSSGEFVNASVVTAGGNVVETNEYVCKKIDGAYYAYSGRIETAPISAIKYYTLEDQLPTAVAFVASDGNDNNIGDSAHPYATVNKALSVGAEVVALKGGNYFQRINLAVSKNKTVKLVSAEKDRTVTFYDPDSLIGTAETLVSGKTKVYSMPCNKTFANGNTWIFQDGTATPSTLIDASERMPLQRGYTYRVDHTCKIQKCTSSALADALNEIENSDNYLWFYDNGTLYFSRRTAVTSSTPLRYSSGSDFIQNATRENTIIASGISVKYMPFNIDNTFNSILSDCQVGCVFGDGAITYDGAVNVKLLRCEAFMCFNGANGDGINAHGSTTGNTFSKQTTATLIDCWVHDNNDDGFSDHERCESTIIGGLFEYNGKAGITPSYGSHCNCYNVYSRKNYSGFFAAGSPVQAEGGVGTQLYCENCIADRNGTGGSQKSGFVVNGSGSILIAENCKSIGQFVGYNALPNAFIRMRDCTALDNDYALNREGTITIENTALVS